MSKILVLERLKQKNHHKFEACLGCIVRFYLKYKFIIHDVIK